LFVKRVKKPRPLTQLFSESSHLRGLLDRVDENARLLGEVQAELPPGLRPHCHAAHIESQQLVLFTDSPAWVMRLRFCSAQLLASLRTARPNLKGVRVRVQLPQRAPRPAQPRASLSPQARQQLLETAATLEEGPLRTALERLGRGRG
jgi:hypothetical protein